MGLKALNKPSLQRLLLDHDIIFYFLTTLNKFMKNFSEVLNAFQNFMENGAFAPIFHNIFKYVNNNSKEQKALFKGVKRCYNGVNLQTATEPHSHCYCLIMRLIENTASYNFGQT